MVRVSPPSVAALALCGALAACAQDATTSAVVGSSLTEVLVRPQDFLLGAPCSSTPGSLQAYVVTLSAFDDEADLSAETLPSSFPLPCSMTLGVRDVVVAGKRYVAEIDGYDRPAADLAPVGGASSGARAMVDGSGQVVPPRWTSRCGSSAETGVVALANESVPVSGCEALVDAQGALPSVVLDPAAIFGPNACALAKLFSVRTVAGSVLLPDSLACDAAPLALPATAGELVRLYARANLLDGSSLGTECAAVVGLGQSIAPACDAPSSTGAVRVDPLIGGFTEACPPGSVYDVRVDGKALSGARIPCTSAASIGPLEPGIVDLEITVYDEDGGPSPGAATCKADVEPGRVVPATCL